MALLDIIYEGDPRLRQKSTKIKSVDAGLRKLAADMRDTMLAAPGVGLAAPQVGVNRRLIVVHVPADMDEDGDSGTQSAPYATRRSSARLAMRSAQKAASAFPAGPATWQGEAITVKAMDLNNRDIRIKLKGYAAGSSSTRSTTSTGCCSSTSWSPALCGASKMTRTSWQTPLKALPPRRLIGVTADLGLVDPAPLGDDDRGELLDGLRHPVCLVEDEVVEVRRGFQLPAGGAEPAHQCLAHVGLARLQTAAAAPASTLGR